MLRYWLPDYEKKLIAELQKQQHSAQFCDTLLQAEGISIPTHSSVLAALSLHLSQRLLASPAPPAGQKRRVQLPALKPQTLIKLVGLLYSGELEVSSVLEQRDVLAAAHLFGLLDLVEGEKVEIRNDQNVCKDCRRVQIEKRDARIQVTPRSFCVSVGTQTNTEESYQTMEDSQHHETTTSSPFPQSCNSFETNTSDNSTSTTFTENSKAYSEGESVLELSTNTTVSLSCPSENITLQLSPIEDSSFSKLQEGEAQQIQLKTSVSGSPVAEVEEDGQRKMSEDKKKHNQENRQGPVFVGKRQVCKAASKSLEKMQAMIETTQISIKVKLRRRRRTKGEIWEVVNMQHPESPAVVTSLTSDNCKKPQADLTADESSPSSDQASVSEPISSSPKPHTSDSLCESTSASSGDPVPLQPPRAVEETDEQIEKLLEDIMIGLNILQKVNKGNDKSRDLNQSHEGGSRIKDKASYCVCYEGYGEQNRNCSTETSTEPCGANCNLNPHNDSLTAGRRDSPQNSQRPMTSSCLSAIQESSPQDDQNVLELLPLSAETEDNLFSMADMQFLPCLSPLDSNNNSTNVNKTPAHSALPRRPWLMDKPQSLQFPLADVLKRQNSPVKPGTSTSCKEKAGSKNESDSPPTKSQRVLRKVGRNLDKVEPSAKKRCPNLILNKTCEDLKVKTDANINLSHCLVSLSSNNVLAKGVRPQTTAPLVIPQTPMRQRLRPTTQSSGETSRKIPIKKRMRSQRSQSIPETSSHDPTASKTGRKRGRPRKILSNREQNEQQIKTLGLEKSDEAPNEAKRSKLEEDNEEGPSQHFKPMDSSIDGKPDYITTAPKEKKQCMVSLKEFQELIKRQHLKTKRTKDKREGERSENTEKDESGVAVMADSIQETDSANSKSGDVDGTEDHSEQSQSTSTPRLSQSPNAEDKPPRVVNDDWRWLDP
ncbi:uncharacterized protein [Eucyclogobius newberryi]|uniref:uncharacterized protein n=1 Tax=Eucyclogobius newberryi TaxID=166745 RepID=UPI003B5C4939